MQPKHTNSNPTPCSCEVETGIFAIHYQRSTTGTINVLPLAVGRMKNGKQVLVCAKVVAGKPGPVVALNWEMIRRPRRVSLAVYSLPRPTGHLNQLGAIDHEGIPQEWQSFRTLPAERVKGYNPKTKVVDTNPVRMTIYQ